MKLSRIFCPLPNQPYAGIPFITRHSKIVDTAGQTIDVASDVVAPENWTQVSVDILAQKYFRRAGVPDRTQRVPEDNVPAWLQRREPDHDAEFSGERDARQVFERLAGCWTYWGWKAKYFDSEADAAIFYDEMRAMLALQIAAPNSPQWFNTGLHWAYGITGSPKGHYYVDPATNDVVAAKSEYERGVPFACFIQSIDDNLVEANGIFDYITKEARIFKGGSGSGANVSNLRGEGEPLSGGGKSSGLMSWLRIADRAAGAIKSGGTTRRAAKMVILDADHPDIETFVGWKTHEEQKVADLVTGSVTFQKKINAVMSAAHDESVPAEQRLDIERNTGLAAALADALSHGIPQGSLQQALDLAKSGTTSITIAPMDTDFNGDAYATVSGQNSNNSVAVPNRFLRALHNGEAWNLTGRTNGQVVKTLDATELWDHIALAAWKCADPGIFYIDTINEWHTCANSAPIRGSNPCSEFLFIDDNSCNLASLRLTAFLDAETGFDVARFQHAAALWTLALEIAIVMGQLPSPAFARNTYDFRTLGLGYADLGTLLMRLGLPYDSENGRNWAAAITALLGGIAYRTSAEMARDFGSFPRYDENAEPMLRVIRNHRRAAHNALPSQYETLSVAPSTYAPIAANANVWDAARNAWDTALSVGEGHGFRNAQVTVLAPAGTIGMLMGCDTTGVEPDFALVKFKKLAGGGYFKMINQSISPALERLGYSPVQIDEIQRYAVGSSMLTLDDKALLSEAGASAESIETLERALPTAMSLEMAAAVAGADLSTIDHQRLDAMSLRLCGAMTLEGAPWLSDDDLAVFDCATPCGLRGTRSIAPRAHVDMLAAVQPYLSGGISKTVNVSQATTVEEVKDIYHYAHGKMIKSVALYRDGSKLSQPLSSSYQLPRAVLDGPVSVAEKIVYRYLAEKRPMSAKAVGYRQKFSIGGHKVYLHTGQYSDGSLGEIFLSTSKEGAAFKALLHCFAMAISVGLQHGVPLEEFVEKFTFQKFEPNGPVTGHDRIKMCTSIIDAIFRDLAVSYLDRDDLAHVSIDTTPTDATVPTIDITPQHTVRAARTNGVATNGVATKLDDRALAKSKGYTGNPCPGCGLLTMVRNGACERCDSCATTSGCS